jgi:hypothetical protein
MVKLWTLSGATLIARLGRYRETIEPYRDCTEISNRVVCGRLLSEQFR